jgi:hypothetical protein
MRKDCQVNSSAVWIWAQVGGIDYDYGSERVWRDKFLCSSGNMGGGGVMICKVME